MSPEVAVGLLQRQVSIGGLGHAGVLPIKTQFRQVGQAEMGRGKSAVFDAVAQDLSAARIALPPATVGMHAVQDGPGLRACGNQLFRRARPRVRGIHAEKLSQGTVH